jgi:hypothetical protein
MEIRPLGAEVLPMDKTYMTKLIFAFFHSFANALKIILEIRRLRKSGNAFWFMTPCTVVEICKLYGATYFRFLTFKNRASYI